MIPRLRREKWESSPGGDPAPAILFLLKGGFAGLLSSVFAEGAGVQRLFRVFAKVPGILSRQPSRSGDTFFIKKGALPGRSPHSAEGAGPQRLFRVFAEKSGILSGRASRSGSFYGEGSGPVRAVIPRLRREGWESSPGGDPAPAIRFYGKGVGLPGGRRCPVFLHGAQAAKKTVELFDSLC